MKLKNNVSPVQRKILKELKDDDSLVFVQHITIKGRLL